MKLRNIILIGAILAFTIFYFSQHYGPGQTEATVNLTSSPASGDEIKIANWNLQIFGDDKAANDTLMDIYVNKIKGYDIIFVQEIRDLDSSAFDNLCLRFNDYSCRVSSRAGRSSSKEQYGLLFKKNLELVNFIDYNLDSDSDKKWERPPVEAEFLINGTKYNIYNIHIKPSDAHSELKELDLMIGKPSEKVIILGDLNADCDYYTREDHLEFPADTWTWNIRDSEDTTVAATDCAYDRIITNFAVDGYGIDTNVTRDVSDIIWFMFK